MTNRDKRIDTLTLLHERREREHDGLVRALRPQPLLRVDPRGRGHRRKEDEGQHHPRQRDQQPDHEGEGAEDVGVDLWIC